MTAAGLTLPVRIAGTAHVAPGDAVTTEALARRLPTPPDAARVATRTGIERRHLAPPGAWGATEPAARALRDALDDAGMLAEALQRIVFVSSVGGDLLLPANASRVAAELGLSRTCDCLDLSNACMGFLSALDVAARSIATGMGPVGIVVAELGSRVVTPDDPRPFLVFGDAVVAVVVDRARGGGGLRASYLRNDGIAGGDVHLTHPMASGRRETIRFTAESGRMGTDAVAYLRDAADAALAEAGLALGDVEWILPHQPNGPILDIAIEALGIAPERVVRVVHDVGSVGAASIPVSLHRLWRSGRVRRGHRILMLGVGAGVSYGAAVLEVE